MEFYSDEVRLYLDEILNNLFKNLLYLLACYYLVSVFNLGILNHFYSEDDL